jgi:hypothetical protein
MQSYPPPPPSSYGPQRPTGITILAILAGLGAASSLYGGLCLISGGIFGGAFLGSLGAGRAGLGLGLFAVISGLLTIAHGALSAGFAYGAWYLKPWAWTLGVIAGGLGILQALFSVINDSSGWFGFLIAVAINGAILYYLFTPEVKRAFGKS